MRCKNYLLLLLLLVTGFARSVAQTPTSCFEIESILVDACGGASEGLNEMLIFHVGPAALNTANMSVAFPTVGNVWTGTCQSATTASVVSQINATITGCGRLREPVGGVLPAGARVILFTSVSVSPLAHSFAALDDTLYAIFHCANYTVGNFANFNAAPSLRTTTMSFTPPGACSETVSYDRSLLTNSNGAQVNFSWANVPTYVSPGCNAPYIPLNPDAGLAQSICAGGTINLAGTVSPGSRPFVWNGGAGSFSNTTILNPSYTLGVGDVGTFWLYLSESTACRTKKDSVLITVLPRPTFSLPADSNFCGNFSYTFGPNLVGSSYAWSNGPSTQNITVTAPGTYTVTLTAANGCTNTDAITIGAFTLGNVGLRADTSICAGSTLTLSPTTPGASYTWSTGATSPSITVSLPGTYTLSMLTGNNCLGRDTFVLGNYALPILDLGNDTTICPGNGFPLNADPLGQNPGATFAWSPNGSGPSISVPGQGTYAVTVTSTQGCVRSDTIVVTESTALSLNLGADTSICQGAALLLNGGFGANSYAWSTGATTQHISVGTAGPVSVIVTFGVNCVTMDTLLLAIDALPLVDLGNDTLYCASLGLTLDAGNPGSTYAWSPAASTQQIALTAGGTYIVTVTNAANCVAADTIVVQTGTEPLVTLGPDVRLCPGSSVTLDAGPGNTTYLWNTSQTTQSISVNSAGLYYVLGTTNCGTDSAAITITVAPAPTVNAGLDDTLCAGDTLLLAGATASGASMIWTASSGTFTAPTTVNSSYVADLNASGPVQLILTVNDTCGTVSDTLVLEILPRLQMVFSLPDTVCYQRQIQISYIGNPTSVLWIGNGTFSDSTGNPTVYTPAPGEAGQIDISAFATGQCGSQVFTTSYYAEDTVIAGFSWTPSTIYPGTYVQFNNQTYLPNLPGHWSFGDGFFSVEHDPEHRFYHPGTYSVELISIGAGGCSDTATLSLNVINPDTLIPNVFSPNGDGINDVFDLKVPPTTAFSLAIFDRWGRQLFLTNDPNYKWDGRLNNADVPEGVYYYVIEMSLLTESILRYNGPVTLLR
jgi:gliding motility-associated-like protein